jgi:hypothetical protein
MSLFGTDLCKENDAPTDLLHVRNVSHVTAYVPYSTRRAVKRAEFDIQRVQNERIRQEAESMERQRLLQQLQQELETLRIEI